MIPFSKANLPYYSKLFLTIIYLVGVVGMVVAPTLFATLTPINLIMAAAFLFYFHEDKNKDFYRFFLFVFSAGFAIELLGVETGKLFGSYHYGEALGFKIKGTPPIIGLNWVVLSYCSGMIAQRWAKPIFTKALIGASLMVLFDFFIELYAAKADFWYWQNDSIPLQNFFAWFVFSFFFNLLFCNFKFDKHNPLAYFLYLIQLLFFIVLNLHRILIQ
ncbi:MAG: carotenoid biosynthesis protein [Bacteroidetes bacterium]|nr:carotenoid biosynthesis protein [Bacteroidota bacterium]